MKKMEYKNRYGETHLFTPDSEGNLLWEGNFTFSRIGLNDDKSYNFVDPSGGPFISVDSKWDGRVVKEIKPVENGFKLVF